MVKFIKELPPLIYQDYKRLRKIRKGLYLCNCGKEFETRIRKTLPKSCGCILKKGMHRTHNKSKISKTYITWLSIKQRCYNPKDSYYKDYGGRGIKMQDNWINNFELFYKYIGERPNNNFSNERIDVNGNYEEGNIKWATQIEQANNRRNNKLIEFDNKKLTLSQWEKELGISQDVLWARLNRGWSIEKSLTFQLKNIKKL